MFRSLFSRKKVPLTGAPVVRRLKTYSAQTGFVYQYYYDGHRVFRSGRENGTEFVFSISADGKTWHATSVRVGDSATGAWEAANGRTLSSTERYAVAKIALFQAFDERPQPQQMKEAVCVREVDVAAIIANLGL